MECGTLSRFFLAAMLLALSPLPSHGVQAATGGLEVVDLLPPNTDRESARSVLSKRANEPVDLVDPSSLLIDSLRWKTTEASRDACTRLAARIREQITSLGLIEPPAADKDLIRALLQQAEKHLTFVEPARALESIDQALLFLPCVDYVLPTEEIRALFLLEGRAHVHLKDNRHAGPFRDALGVDPKYLLPSTYADDVRIYFLEAKTEFMETEPLAVDEESDGLELFVDGKPREDIAEIHPGRHIIQKKGPYGEIRTDLVSVTGVAGTSVNLDALSRFDLPTAAEVQSALVQGLTEMALSPIQVQALDRYIQRELPRRGEDWIVFGLASPRKGRPILIAYLYGAGLRNKMPGWRDPELEFTQPISLRAGMGALILAGGGGAFTLEPVAAGYVLQVDLYSGKLRFGGRLSIYPHQVNSYETTGGTTGCEASSSADREGALGCVPSSTILQGGLGLGLSFPLSKRTQLIPALYLEATYLPNVILDGYADVAGETALVNVIGTGPMARLSLTHALTRKKHDIHLTLELFGGATITDIEGYGFLTGYPAGLELCAGASF